MVAHNDKPVLHVDTVEDWEQWLDADPSPDGVRLRLRKTSTRKPGITYAEALHTKTWPKSTFYTETAWNSVRKMAEEGHHKVRLAHTLPFPDPISFVGTYQDAQYLLECGFDEWTD